MEELEDIDIVQQILDGKKNLYRVIVVKYQNSIFSFMLRFTGSRPQAEELTQESFMRAYTALDRFNTRKKFFPWLYTIALNIARDWKRKDQGQLTDTMSFPENLSVDTIEFDPEVLITRNEDMALVQKGLAALSPEHREAVILRFRHELSIKEISEVFNISSSASKMRIHRGLQQLKQFMHHEKN